MQGVTNVIGEGQNRRGGRYHGGYFSNLCRFIFHNFAVFKTFEGLLCGARRSIFYAREDIGSSHGGAAEIGGSV